MSDLEEQMMGATERARLAVAEKHFFDKAQPHFPFGFSINWRNHGHWDVFANQCPGRASAFMTAYPGSPTSGKDGERERAFRIRGEHGNVIVIDERWNPHQPVSRKPMRFRSIASAMLWICEELMGEPPR